MNRRLRDWLVAVCILYPLSTAAVLLRLLAVRVRGRGLKLSDYLVILSWICQTGYLVVVSVEGLNLGGYGLLMHELPLDRITHSLRAFWISEWFWAFGVCSFRLAVVLLYMDLFRTDTVRYRVLVVTSSVIVAYLVSCILVICLLCQPIQFNWDVTLTHGKCGNEVAIEYFSAAFNMVLDLWVVYLPLPTIWTLQLSPQKKWILTASFSLGLGTAAANLGRLIQTVQCVAVADTTFCFLNSSITAFAEFSSGILTACVPLLGPLLPGRSHGRPSSSTPDGPTDGRLRTIGSIPLRVYKRHKEDDSLFLSNIETHVEAGGQGTPPGPDGDATAALAPRAAQMGHWTEIWPQGQGSTDSAVGMMHGGTTTSAYPTTEKGMYHPREDVIVRTLEYTVDRRGD